MAETVYLIPFVKGMFDTVKHHIQSIVNFGDEDLTLFLSHLVPKSIKKYDFMVREGEYCNQVAFINKGAMRIYYTRDGREHTGGFYLQGNWISEYESFLGKKKSLFYVDALEDTELFMLSYDNMQKLYARGRLFERFGRIIAEQLFLDTVTRQSELFLLTPEERYLNLLKEQPHLFSLVSLRQIASYLGIEPESLSRIRKRLNKTG